MFQSQKFPTTGKTISLTELLDARETRANLQETLRQKHKQTVLSITLTAVGGVKKNALLDFVFAKCLENVTACFKRLAVSPTESLIRPLETGHEALFALPIDAMQLKRAMIALEDSSPLARLWDLDVISAEGELLSRSELGFAPRPCLVCAAQAKVCARERRHSIDDIIAEMQQRAQAVLFAENIAEQVNQALLAEVNLTPKPGLVDQANSGAHKDMDITTFQYSCEALYPFWTKFVYLGFRFASKPTDEILPLIRPLGMQAEQAMFRATEGVNTHKGAIFIFGLVCCVLGRLWLNQPRLFSKDLSRLIRIETICEEVAKITQGITQELQNYPDYLPLTHGVKLFRYYGLTGARGAAEQGFPLVQNVLKQAIEKAPFLLADFSSVSSDFCSQIDFSHNSICWHRVLLYLMAENPDTNVVHRSGLAGLMWLQQQAEYILHSPTNLIEQLKQFDKACIQRNISAGGSADLLGLTLFFYFLTL